MDPEIIHIPQLAQMLSRTESSIRSAIRDGAQWLPPTSGKVLEFVGGSRLFGNFCASMKEDYYLRRSPVGRVGSRRGYGPSIKTNADARTMKTLFILMAQYDGLAVIPLERVCADYFNHLTPEKMKMKVAAGQIRLPITQIEASQKAARGIHIQDLAAYIDARHAEAVEELEKLHRR
jgi:hypothetical protein